VREEFDSRPGVISNFEEMLYFENINFEEMHKINGNNIEEMQNRYYT
jgi:hypothetical protein